ncbi:hypothetical protein TNCV_57811 [Trichonephila clavipes]|nr:hypothetical protein TNCV_57811 [Trichonephila clavipes]
MLWGHILGNGDMEASMSRTFHGGSINAQTPIRSMPMGASKVPSPYTTNLRCHIQSPQQPSSKQRCLPCVSSSVIQLGAYHHGVLATRRALSARTDVPMNE